jgi:hypothetical protein
VSNNVHQVVMTPRREHSRKPDQVADRIVELLGDVPRIELFARGSRPGWDVWGDEATQVASNSVRPTTATPVVERLVGTTSPKVIVYTYADGTHAWRYASENTLRYEAADEMLAAVRQQIKDAGELDPVLAAMMATGASPRGAP